jgi:hypothetical protein
MNCPHCNSPARDDWPCEFRCGSITHSGGEFYRSNRCFGNEIEQLKTTVDEMAIELNRLSDLEAEHVLSKKWRLRKADQ